MRRLFNVIFQLLAAALLIFLFTALWIVYDGLNDQGGKADVAWVTGPPGPPGGHAARPRLDRAVQLYNEGEFPMIILSVSRNPGADTEPDAMAKYLEDHGVPSSAIMETRHGATTQETARMAAAIMKSRGFQSVMLVTDYYRMTRMKLALNRDGIAQIEKAHVGKLRKEDAWQIGREVVALYVYVGKTYLLPAAEKVKKEAEVGADNAKADAEKAKEKVDKSLDGMAK